MRTFLIMGFLAVLTAGCQFPGPNTFDAFAPPAPVALSSNDLQTVESEQKMDPQLLRPPTEIFTLGPGDHMEIELMDDIASRETVTVGPDGKIYFGMLPGVDVWGLTVDQAKDLLEKELTKYMREKPLVGITLRGVESKKIWLLGRFQSPGIYAMTNSLTLLEAIFQAGGPQNMMNMVRDSSAAAAQSDDLADLAHSFVVRNGKLLPVDFRRLFKGDLSQNIYLEPDDFVYLPPQTADEVHVFGAVNTPRAVAYVRQLTLVQALANCNGPISGQAYMRQVAIVRGSLTKPRIAIINFKEITRGQLPDVYLAPGDIVYVPYMPWRIINKYLDVVATTFVSSVAINEGARAVLATPPPTTGILIPFGSSIIVSPIK